MAHICDPRTWGWKPEDWKGIPVHPGLDIVSKRPVWATQNCISKIKSKKNVDGGSDETNLWGPER